MELDMDDGCYFLFMVKNVIVYLGLELLLMMVKEKLLIIVVGDVGGCIVIIVDDIIDDVESFVVVVEILKERGVYKIYVMVIYGILFVEVFCLIEEFFVDEVVVMNIVFYEV